MLQKSENAILEKSLGAVIGNTPELRTVYQLALIASRSLHPVLIVGEVGTRKEVLARAIHSLSPSHKAPVIALDCATLDPLALQTDLLRGAAGESGGCTRTVVLNEIDHATIDVQGALLHILHQREQSDERNSQQGICRIMATATRDLRHAVSRGTFRRDLYFRLNAFVLRVPPLRERVRDIPLLSESFVNHLSGLAGRNYQISDEAMQTMIAYNWPGNVRELQACIETACRFALSSVITVVDLPESIRPASVGAACPVRIVPLKDLERRSIEQALAQVKGDKVMAAKLLGIGRSTLYRKLRDYALDRAKEAFEKLPYDDEINSRKPS